MLANDNCYGVGGKVLGNSAESWLRQTVSEPQLESRDANFNIQNLSWEWIRLKFKGLMPTLLHQQRTTSDPFIENQQMFVTHKIKLQNVCTARQRR